MASCVDVTHVSTWWAEPDALAWARDGPAQAPPAHGATEAPVKEPFDVIMGVIDNSGYIAGSAPCPLMASAKAARHAMAQASSVGVTGAPRGASTTFPGLHANLGPAAVTGVVSHKADVGAAVPSWVDNSTVQALWAAPSGKGAVPVRLAVVGRVTRVPCACQASVPCRCPLRSRGGAAWWCRLSVDTMAVCSHGGVHDARLLWSTHADIKAQLRSSGLEWTRRGVRLPSLWSPAWEFQVAVGNCGSQPWDEAVLMAVAREAMGDVVEEVRAIGPLSFVDVTDGWQNLAYALTLRSRDHILDRDTATSFMERFRACIGACLHVRVQGD